jgi:hypothetical protein
LVEPVTDTGHGHPASDIRHTLDINPNPPKSKNLKLQVDPNLPSIQLSAKKNNQTMGVFHDLTFPVL